MIVDAKLVTVLLAVSAAACFAGGAFVPNPQAQAAIFAVGSFLLGVIGVTRPADVPLIQKGRAFQRDRERASVDLTKIRKATKL